MGDPSDDDVPTMTSSADLRRDDDGSGADSDDRTIQKPPDAVDAIEQGAERDRERTMMAKAPKPPLSTRSPISSPNPVLPTAPRPAAGLGAVPADKLPPPPSHPLRPRLPSSAGVVSPASRPIPTPQPFAAKADSAAKLGVARPEPVKNEPAKSDSKSDVRTVQSKADSGSHEVEGPEALESEPPPSEPLTSPKSPAIPSAPAPMTPKMASTKAPMTPKMPGAPSPLAPKAPAAPVSKPRSPSQPSAQAPAAVSASAAAAGDAVDDGDGDSITATAPRVSAPIIPLSPPKQVEIRTLAEQDDDDAGDETEVKTLSANIGDIVRRVDAANASEADAQDDSVTAQAPAHPVPPLTPAAGAPAVPAKAGAAAVIRIGEKSLMPNKGAGQAAPSAPYNPDEEDSVTARGLEVKGADYPDDSVTAQSPNAVTSSGLEGPIDETEGTTKRVRKSPPKPADPNASEADELDDSVTAAAPGHLTNMLRVIASPSEADATGRGDDDDATQAHTQVMLNAPVKPPEHSRRGRPEPPPNSEGALLAAGRDPHALGGDRASLGALGVHPRHDGQYRAALGSDPNLGGMPIDRVSHAPFAAPMPMPVPDDEKKPPYALLVAVVAAISILVPVLLFIVLSQSNDEAAPRVTSQPSPDPVGVTGPRPKAGKPGPSTSPQPTTQPRPNGGGPINRGPLRR